MDRVSVGGSVVSLEMNESGIVLRRTRQTAKTRNSKVRSVQLSVEDLTGVSISAFTDPMTLTLTASESALSHLDQSQWPPEDLVIDIGQGKWEQYSRLMAGIIYQTLHESISDFPLPPSRLTGVNGFIQWEGEVLRFGCEEVLVPGISGLADRLVSRSEVVDSYLSRADEDGRTIGLVVLDDKLLQRMYVSTSSVSDGLLHVPIDHWPELGAFFMTLPRTGDRSPAITGLPSDEAIITIWEEWKRRRDRERSAPSPDASRHDSYLGELRALADLRDSGVITLEEFELQKARILPS